VSVPECTASGTQSRDCVHELGASLGDSAAVSLRKTPLNPIHRALGARMMDFGGWEMPVEYPSMGGLVAEHKAVRAGVGVFDVSHMGDIRIYTRNGSPGSALAAVEHITMNRVSRLAVGQAQYSAMLYPEGTFVDDVIVHRLGADDFLLVINAGTRSKDIAWVREATKGFACEVMDLSDDYTQLAVQGPRAVDVIEALSGGAVRSVQSYWFTWATLCGLKNVLIARTGYTGEDGFEIYLPSDAETSAAVWRAVFDAGREFGIRACGLGARNTLRLEARLPLYGHEISETIDVWEAGLERFCRIEKSEFIGRDALVLRKARGLTRTLVGIEMVDRAIARDGYRCFSENGDEVGIITSGSPSPTLGKNIALALVPPALAAVGTTLYVQIRGQKSRARVVPTPFYRRAQRIEARPPKTEGGSE
jgi:aminomethyltransferase